MYIFLFTTFGTGISQELHFKSKLAIYLECVHFFRKLHSFFLLGVGSGGWNLYSHFKHFCEDIRISLEKIKAYAASCMITIWHLCGIWYHHHPRCSSAVTTKSIFQNYWYLQSSSDWHDRRWVLLLHAETADFQWCEENPTLVLMSSPIITHC